MHEGTIPFCSGTMQGFADGALFLWGLHDHPRGASILGSSFSETPTSELCRTGLGVCGLGSRVDGIQGSQPFVHHSFSPFT